MVGSTTERPIFLARAIYALAWVVTGLSGGLGCGQDAPGPSGAAGCGSNLINDVLQVEHAFSGGELCFALCYDMKEMRRAGSSATGRPDGSDEANAYLVTRDGVALNLKYVSKQSAIEINGKQYSHSAGRIFHCKVEGGTFLIEQFLVAPELMKGDWPDRERMTKVLESIPELRQILKKGKSD